MSQPFIDLQHISKSFDGELVLDDLNLSIRGEQLRHLCLAPAAAARPLPCVY